MSNATNVTDISRDFCYLPKGTAPTSLDAPTCNPDQTWLRTLIILNAVAASTSLLVGHQAVRDRLPSWLRSAEWQPWGGTASFVLQASTTIASAAISRSNGYESDFLMMTGVWAMRPRVAVLNVLWAFAFRSDFLWSLQDSVMTEGLLNLATLGLAIKLRNGLEGDSYGCRVRGERPTDASSYANLFSTLNYAVIAACSSTFQMALLLIKYVQGDADRFKGKNSVYTSNWFFSGIDLAISGLFFMTTLGSLVSGWVFWRGETSSSVVFHVVVVVSADAEAGYISLGGNHYCPGSPIGIGVAFGVTFVVSALLRPLFGGADN